MINVGVTWQQAAVLTGGLAVTAAVLRQSGAQLAGDPGTRRSTYRFAVAAGFVREAALLCGLFTLWQVAGSFSLLGHDDAVGRASWIWHQERAWHLPNEAGLQAAFLPHPLLLQIFNLYYAILHFPVLFGCLIWLFIARRDYYRRIRTTLVVFTGCCLLIQLIPVAPPRLLPETGMVDTAVRYGQSVYQTSTGFDADEFSAMPSIHVGWAILVAIAVIGAVRSRWRWLAVLYPVATTLIVVVTANHFWLDGIVAAAVLVVVLAGQAVARRLRARRPVPHADDERAAPRAAPAGSPGYQDWSRAPARSGATAGTASAWPASPAARPRPYCLRQRGTPQAAGPDLCRFAHRGPATGQAAARRSSPPWCHHVAGRASQ